MAEPFKDRISPALVRTIAQHVQRVWPDFAATRFRRRAVAGLAALELKQRVVHVADALAEHLPADFGRAADLLEATLAPARADDDLRALVAGENGLAGWPVWPLTTFVERHGLADPERSLAALHAMTQRHTAEFALRPFLIEHRRRTMQALRRWAQDPSPHVRRLVSEGSRPRLPWGVRLDHLVRDPSPTLPLLRRLQDDGSAYVRRSVANHLNDIAKDHPQVVAEWLERHLVDAGSERRALLRHASRTLVKRGDRRVLAAFGYGERWRGAATLQVTPPRVARGGEMELQVTLRSALRRSQSLLVDYVVHHVRAGGRTSARTWKLCRVELTPGACVVRRRRHSWRPVTTRRDRPGRHDVELLVNGEVVASTSFELT